MPARPDISDNLTHFTSGATLAGAYERLGSIVAERRLVGSGEKIRGGWPCICFTEAPLTSLSTGLVNPKAYSRYSPFGVIFDKSWIFQAGGRPVIYQPDAEFEGLPEDIRWRHMRYEPGIVDFTWEREWRVRRDQLQFDPSIAAIVVPNHEWAARLVEDHEGQQNLIVLEYAQVIDGNLAEQYREGFPWRIFVLGEEAG